jgi:hypothetical protein
MVKRSLMDPIQHIPGKIPIYRAEVTAKAKELVHGVVQQGDLHVKSLG